MKFDTYVFSEDYEIIEIDPNSKIFTMPNGQSIPESYQTEIDKLHNKEAFLMYHKHRGRFYLINPTIKFFLEAFKTPHTLAEVINELALKAECSPQSIENQTMEFFSSMLENQILVAFKGKYTGQEDYPSVFVAGEIVDEFRINKMLTGKTRVEVYLAEHVENRKLVVFKVLKKEYIGQPLEYETFVQEFRIMKEVGSHKNICELIKFHCEPEAGYVYGIIEYVAGNSPWTMAKREVDPLSLADRLQIIEQMLAALGHVHEKGVVHGDIHASNFLVSDAMHLNLIDFGMSNHETPWQNEIIIQGGVNHYMPPEKLSESSLSFAKGQADFRSEVFQLGVTCFLILYGYRPFQGFSWESLSKAIQEDQPRFDLKVPQTEEKIPTPFISIIKKALKKLPKDRFNSAREMYEAWTFYLKAYSYSAKTLKSPLQISTSNR